jgi:RNA polymerase sigma factor (sigma-70 family)
MTTEAPQTTREVVETVLLDPRERGKLVGVATSRFGISPEDAEDLLQETALELLRQRQYVHSPRGYVYAVFKKRCAGLLRLRKRQGYSGPLSNNLPTDFDRLCGIDRTDKGIAIRQALCRISVSCRKLLSAYYVQGKTIRETAAEMERAFSGVGSVINRCLNRLRACLS